MDAPEEAIEQILQELELLLGPDEVGATPAPERALEVAR